MPHRVRRRNGSEALHPKYFGFCIHLHAVAANLDHRHRDPFIQNPGQPKGLMLCFISRTFSRSIFETLRTPREPGPLTIPLANGRKAPLNRPKSDNEACRFRFIYSSIL